MAKKTYTIHADPPEKVLPDCLPWDYGPTFWPRKHYLKADAERCADAARKRGGRNVRITPEKPVDRPII